MGIKEHPCPKCCREAGIVFLKFPSMTTTSDMCDPFKSMADGQYYSSKVKYRRSLRDHGMNEVGNESVEPKPFKPISVKKLLHENLLKIEERNG